MRMFLEQAVAVRSSRPELDTIYVTCGDKKTFKKMQETAVKFKFRLYDK